MTAAQIAIASTYPRGGFVIAVMPAPDPYTSGARLVVGAVRRISADGAAELWRAWLWPSPGGVMHVTQSCEAADAPALDRLRDKLQKRGPWWASRQPGQVPPDHPDAGKPVGWGEHPRDCDCGECP